jgi:hypothetical protein
MTDREQLAREVFDRFNRGEYEPDPANTHPDIEVVTESSRLTGEPYRGFEGLRRCIAETSDAFEEWTISVGEIEEPTPDRLLIVGTMHLRGRGSGVTVDLPRGWVFDYEGELCTRMESFPNRVEEARSAARR